VLLLFDWLSLRREQLPDERTAEQPATFLFTVGRVTDWPLYDFILYLDILRGLLQSRTVKIQSQLQTVGMYLHYIRLIVIFQSAMRKQRNLIIMIPAPLFHN
jgi:hypothetical protein